MIFSEFEIFDPWRDLKNLRDEVNRAFADYQGGTYSEYPPVNVWVGNENALLTAELPGIGLENIGLSISGDTLTLKGEYKDTELEKGRSYHRKERPYGKFVRSIKLPFPVDNAKSEANYKNGILSVYLPLAEIAQQKTIKVKAA